MHRLCFEVFLPLPLGEGWGEGLCASSFAPSPNPSQREGNKPQTFHQLVQTFLQSVGLRRGTDLSLCYLCPTQTRRATQIIETPRGKFRWLNKNRSAANKFPITP